LLPTRDPLSNGRAFFFFLPRPPPPSTLFPYTTLFRSLLLLSGEGTYIDKDGKSTRIYPGCFIQRIPYVRHSTITKEDGKWLEFLDRKSTRLNSSHVSISYAVFCLKKKKQILFLPCYPI